MTETFSQRGPWFVIHSGSRREGELPEHAESRIQQSSGSAAGELGPESHNPRVVFQAWKQVVESLGRGIDVGRRERKQRIKFAF